MKLITFLLKNNPKSKRIGAIKNNTVIDFSSSDLPKDMINFIKLGSTGLDIANDVIENQKNVHAIDDVILKAPIDKPVTYDDGEVTEDGTPIPDKYIWIEEKATWEKFNL